MTKLPITVVIAAKNEEINLRGCLSSLQRASQVVLVDSGSGDGTAAIAREFGAEVVQFDYPGGYPKKRQWMLDHLAPRYPWILLVDADERIPDALWAEIEGAIQATKDCSAFFVTKGFHF